MRTTLASLLVLCLSPCGAPAVAVPLEKGAPCIEDRAALLALDQDAFDQDMTGGWRAVSETPGCEEAAADLIRDYRLTRAGDNPDKILFWHEGQVRAFLGQTEQAISLFRQSHGGPDDIAWNLYADATIAFLEKDRDALVAARDELLALPKPDYWDEMVANTQAKYNFTPVWPNNANVVERLVSCFGAPYKTAYGACDPTLTQAPSAASAQIGPVQP